MSYIDELRKRQGIQRNPFIASVQARYSQPQQQSVKIEPSYKDVKGVLPLSMRNQLLSTPTIPMKGSGLPKTKTNTQTNNPEILKNLFLRNDFPIYKNDPLNEKITKGLDNFIASIWATPGELARKTALQFGNIASGNGIASNLPKKTSFVENILPKSASNKLNQLEQSHPIAGTIAKTGLEMAADPMTWISAKGIANAINKPTEAQKAIQLAQKSIGKTNLPAKTASKKVSGNITPKLAKSDLTKTIKEPNILEGLRETGTSGNARTDLGNPDILRNTFSENPLTYEQLANKETLAKAQEIFNQGIEPARTQLSDLISNMKPEAAPLAKMISRQMSKSGNVQGAREVLSELSSKMLEAGQFGQAGRILREADPETFLMTIEKQLTKLNKEGLKVYGKKWANIDLTPKELNLVGQIERGNQSQYEKVFEQIQSRIANELPATAMEKVNAWRHISMLLNPKTQIRNVGGNAIMMGMRKSAQRVSGVLQKVALKPEERTQAVFVKPEYKDLAKQFFEANKKDLLASPNKFVENIRLNMPNKRVFQNNALESTRKFTYKLLEMGDVPFFKNAYIDRLASYAQAKGIKNFSELPQNAFGTALKEAEQATYKDASRLANFLNKWKNPGANAGIGKNTIAFFTEAALPFTKTPISIIKRGIQYSPAGIINGLSKIKSAEGAAAAIDEMAKGLTGTATLGLGYLLAKNGILTGKASDDADLKAYDQNTGNYPFSILGKYSYDWAQPFSIPLSVGVEIYNAIKNNPEDTAKMDNVVLSNDETLMMKLAGIFEGAWDAVSASGDTVFNMSLMRGIKNLLGNPKGFTAGLTQLPINYATQFVPTLSSQAAGTVDPLVRQTYVKGNYPESAKAAILSKIPFASMTLQPKQTPFGEDMKKIENPVGRSLSQFLSPGIVTKKQNVNPTIDAEIKKLAEEGYTKQIPTVVPNYIEKTKNNPKITLTPKEQTQYQKRTGQLSLEAFGKVMNSNEYRNGTEEVKSDLLAKAISDAKAQAKAEILLSRGYNVTSDKKVKLQTLK